MFRAVHRLARREGFSLIELLITMSIVMVLAAVAVPMFLGIREKARRKAVEASARGAVSEVHSILNSYLRSEPFVVYDLSGSQKCYEYENASAVNRCASKYKDVSVTGAYPQGDLDNLVDILVDHYSSRAGGDMGVSKDSPVFTSGLPGTMVFTAIGGSSIGLSAYPRNSAVVVFNTVISSR